MKKWMSILLMLLVLCAAALAEPAITVPDQVQAGKPFSFSWTPVEDAAGYEVSVFCAGNYVTGDRVMDTSYAVNRYDIAQGVYQVKVNAFGDPYKQLAAMTADITVGAPDPECEIYYQPELTWNGEKYAVSSVVAAKLLSQAGEVVIPATVPSAPLQERPDRDTRNAIPDGELPVARISGSFISQKTESLTVTIPRTVKVIDAGAFDKVQNLTIRGETGTVAEQYAMLNGHTFIPLDDGEGDFSVTWKGDIKVGNATTFTLKGMKNYDWVWARLNGEDIVVGNRKASGKDLTVKPEFEKAGTYYLQFEISLEDKSRLYSKMISIEVLADGQMITVGNIQVDRPVIERGSTVRVKFIMPDGHTEFMYGINEPAYESWGWHPIHLDVNSGYYAISGTKNVTFRMDGNYFVDTGAYSIHIGLPTVNGLEQTAASVDIEVISTRPFGYFEYREEIFDYVGGETDVIVPATIDDMPVKLIANEAFKGVPFTSVLMEEGIESIGNNAFQNCSRMVSITLPESITEIGKEAFLACTKLESVVLPAKMTRLESGLFLNCHSLKEVVLPAELKGMYATTSGYYTMPFTGCENLKRVVFPDGNLSMEKGCLPPGVTIVAPVGSTAQEYAQKVGHPFEALEN